MIRTDYKTVLHNDLGWATKIGDAKFYAQAGPALVIPDGGDQPLSWLVRLGIKLKVNKNLGVYGEISAMTKDQMDFRFTLAGNENWFQIFILMMDYLQNKWEQGELLNGRLAMLGVVAAVGAYAVTGQIIPGFF